MPIRLVAVVLAVLSLSITASALTTPRFSDPALVAAAGRLKVKDYPGAREAAIKSVDKGVRAFVIGMCDVKIELYDEAAAQLAYAAEAFPLLADYALYNEALALSKAPRKEEALAPLARLLKGYPASRLARPALLLEGDTLFALGRFKEALDAYGTFLERYPLGGDALTALLGSALCRERLGDPAQAVTILRGVWINHPNAQVAAQAADELARIGRGGGTVPPYTAGELFKRACTLYDLGQYAKAARELADLAPDTVADDFSARVRLKLGQAQVKTKHFKEAQESLKPLAEKGGSAEATYWYARALDKGGQQEEAFTLYSKLAASTAAGSLANDALVDAAYLRRYQGRTEEALRLFQTLLTRNLESPRRANIIWEAAWLSFQSRNYQDASDYLRRLAATDECREKALYWLGRSQAAAGDTKGAEAQYATLRAEYPYGYYALLCNNGCVAVQIPQPPQSLTAALPLPPGMEWEKALIALGFFDEAGRELAALKKPKGTVGLARLYLEMENYNGAFHLLQQEQPKNGGEESAVLWGVSYPLAFREEVAKYAAANKVPESLVYAVMRAESNFSTTALSPVGAVGLMQIMPATAERIDKGGSARLTVADLNIRLGTRHLRDLLDSYSGNIALSVASYNAGSGNVRRWQKAYGGLPQDEFVENIPFKETRDYVKKVLAVMALYQKMYALPTVSPLAGK